MFDEFTHGALVKLLLLPSTNPELSCKDIAFLMGRYLFLYSEQKNLILDSVYFSM